MLAAEESGHYVASCLASQSIRASVPERQESTLARQLWGRQGTRQEKPGNGSGKLADLVSQPLALLVTLHNTWSHGVEYTAQLLIMALCVCVITIGLSRK